MKVHIGWEDGHYFLGINRLHTDDHSFGARRYGSHGPTVAQWCMVGAALNECGVDLPPDWADVLEARV